MEERLAMAATGSCFIAGGFLPVFGWGMKSSAGGLRTYSVSVRSSAVFTEQTPAPGVSERGKSEKMSEAEMISKHFPDLDAAEMERRSLKDYFEQAKELIRADGGPPRWFSPLECGSPSDISPPLLFLPGFYIICSFKKNKIKFVQSILYESLTCMSVRGHFLRKRM